MARIVAVARCRGRRGGCRNGRARCRRGSNRIRNNGTAINRDVLGFIGQPYHVTKLVAKSQVVQGHVARTVKLGGILTRGGIDYRRTRGGTVEGHRVGA